MDVSFSELGVVGGVLAFIVVFVDKIILLIKTLKGKMNGIDINSIQQQCMNKFNKLESKTERIIGIDEKLISIDEKADLLIKNNGKIFDQINSNTTRIAYLEGRDEGRKNGKQIRD